MEYPSSVITTMNRKRSEWHNPALGQEMRRRIIEHYRTQTAFSEALGVPQGTISRWVNGRRPDGDYLDDISDLLFWDYDDLATQAGYRPRGLSIAIDPKSPEGQLVPYIRRIDWTDRDLRRQKAQLRELAKEFPAKPQPERDE